MQIKTTALLLFIAMDAPGNLPIFISTLRRLQAKRRWRIILREMLLVLMILMLFLFFGKMLLNCLNLRLETLTLAGGLILFLIAWRMIFPRQSVPSQPDNDVEPFLVPLAVPLVAGPSVLSIILQQTMAYPQQMSQMMIAILCAWVPSLLILLGGNHSIRWIGEKGLIALERLMGLILLFVSTQMMVDGMRIALFNQ